MVVVQQNHTNTQHRSVNWAQLGMITYYKAGVGVGGAREGREGGRVQGEEQAKYKTLPFL